jgi:hypothetical protein
MACALSGDDGRAVAREQRIIIFGQRGEKASLWAHQFAGIGVGLAVRHSLFG